MNKLYKRHRILFLIVLDMILISLSYSIAFYLRFDFKNPEIWIKPVFNWLPMILLLQLTFFFISDFYKSIWRFTSLWELFSIIKLVSISSLISFLIIFGVSSFEGYPRSVLLIFYLTNILIICFSRISVRVYYSHFKVLQSRKIRINKKKLILVGAGKTGEKIIREIVNTPGSHYEVVGLVDDSIDRIGKSIHGFPIFCKIDNLKNLEIEYDEILITIPSASGDQMRMIVDNCKLTEKRYKTVPSLNELIDKDISISEIRDVSYVDLLGRDEINLDLKSIKKFLNGKRILISGAGGSIGFQLLKQCLAFEPSEIICIDFNEESIFNIGQKDNFQRTRTIIKPILVNILNINQLNRVYFENRPHIVFHAAAYKHVPIQEVQPWTAVHSNVEGTKNMIELSHKYNAEKFVLVSTDKAVNPVNIMGATKRLAEKLIQSHDIISKTKFLAVRFGNVLGSSGSVIPIFKKQIKNGGPVTITHPEMTRYFMSIPEAAQLILQAGALGRKGNIFLLEMGKPIKIDRMARDLIRLLGFEPETEIPIVYTGLRPGEKLYEELQMLGENKLKTNHTKILILKDQKRTIPWEELKLLVESLIEKAEILDHDGIQSNLRELIPTYQPRLYNSINVEKSVTPYSIKGEA